MKKQITFSILIFLIIVGMLGFTYAQGAGRGGVPFNSSNEITSSAGVTYDSNLLKALENSIYSNSLLSNPGFIGLKIINDKLFARVSVVLKDNSGIEIVGNKSEKRELVNQIIEWFEKETEEILKDYSGSDFILRGKTSGGFGLLVTEEGFDKLIQDSRIEKVIWIDSKPELTLAESASLINADDAWSFGYTGEGVKVCIIDTGIDTNHIDLEDRIADEYCYCSDNCCPDNTAEDDSAEDDNVAWLGDLGNIILKGNCYSGGSCDNPGPDSFIIRNSTGENVAYLNSTGDLCITNGDCSDKSANCNSPSGNSFLVRNESHSNVIYLDETGDLCLIGELYENTEL